MILEMKQMLRNAKWLWLLIALSMIWGFLINLVMRSKGDLGSSLLIVNGEPLTLKYFKTKLKREELIRAQLAAWGLKLGPVSHEEVLARCEKSLLLKSLARKLDVEIDDTVLAEHIKKQFPKDLFEGDQVIAESYELAAKRMGFDSVEELEEDVRSEIAERWVKEVVKQSDLKKELSEADENGEAKKVELEIIEIDRDQLREEIGKKEIAESLLQEFYENHKDRYKDKGKAFVKVLELSHKAVDEKVSVSEKEIQDYFKRNKIGKYSMPNSYTVDFWIFDPELIAEKNSSSTNISELAQECIDKCLDANMHDQLKECEEEAKEMGLTLRLIRNHKFVIGSGRFSKGIEEKVKSIKEKGQMTEVFPWESKFYALRLVDVETGFESKLEDVRKEIESTIRKKKAEYEVARVSDYLFKKIRDLGAVKFDEDSAEKLLQDLGLNSELMDYSEIVVGDAAKQKNHKVTKDLADRIDSLEIGKMGKLADTDKEIMYIVQRVEKRKPKSFDQVKGKVQDDYLSNLSEQEQRVVVENTKKALHQKENIQKASFISINKKSLKAEEKEISEGLKLSSDEAKKILQLSDERLVLLLQKGEKSLLIRRVDGQGDLFKKDKKSDSGYFGYQEDILVWLGKTARIERADSALLTR